MEKIGKKIVLKKSILYNDVMKSTLYQTRFNSAQCSTAFIKWQSARYEAGQAWCQEFPLPLDSQRCSAEALALGCTVLECWQPWNIVSFKHTVECTIQYILCIVQEIPPGASTWTWVEPRQLLGKRCLHLYCTVLYCTLLYCIVQYFNVMYSTALHCTTLHCTV